MTEKTNNLNKIIETFELVELRDKLETEADKLEEKATQGKATKKDIKQLYYINLIFKFLRK